MKKETKVKPNITMKESVWKDLKIRAIQEDKSASEIIEKLVEEYLKK